MQADFTEILIGVSGAGAVAVNGIRLGFEAGQVVDLPLGHTLAIENTTNEPLRYFIIKATPAG